MISRELVQERLNDLNRQFEEKQADMLAIEGARQDCTYWFEVLDELESGNTEAQEKEEERRAMFPEEYGKYPGDYLEDSPQYGGE